MHNKFKRKNWLHNKKNDNNQIEFTAVSPKLLFHLSLLHSLSSYPNWIHLPITIPQNDSPSYEFIQIQLSLSSQICVWMLVVVPLWISFALDGVLCWEYAKDIRTSQAVTHMFNSKIIFTQLRSCLHSNGFNPLIISPPLPFFIRVSSFYSFFLNKK